MQLAECKDRYVVMVLEFRNLANDLFPFSNGLTAASILCLSILLPTRESSSNSGMLWRPLTPMPLE